MIQHYHHIIVSSCRLAVRVTRIPWFSRLQRVEFEQIKIIKDDGSSSTSAVPHAFTIISVSGRIYEVKFDPTYSCSCPYFHQHPTDLCKHLLFLLINYYQCDLHQQSTERQLIDQLPDLINHSKVNSNPNLYIDEKIRQKYQQVLSKSVSGEKTLSRENDLCIICFEVLDHKNTEVACPNCRNLLHQSCLQQWLDRQASCPYCRGHWVLSDDPDHDTILGIKYLKIS